MSDRGMRAGEASREATSSKGVSKGGGSEATRLLAGAFRAFLLHQTPPAGAILASIYLVCSGGWRDVVYHSILVCHSD